MSKQSRARQRERNNGGSWWQHIRSWYQRASLEADDSQIARDLKKIGLDTPARCSWNQWPFVLCWIAVSAWQMFWCFSGDGRILSMLCVIAVCGILLGIIAMQVPNMPIFSFRYWLQIFSGGLLAYGFSLLSYLGMPGGGIGVGFIVVAFGLGFIPVILLKKFPAGWCAAVIKIVVTVFVVGMITVFWCEAAWTIPQRFFIAQNISDIEFSHGGQYIPIPKNLQQRLLHGMRWLIPAYPDAMGANPNPTEIAASPFKLRIIRQNGKINIYQILIVKNGKKHTVWFCAGNDFYSSTRLYSTIRELMKAAPKAEEAKP